MLHICYSDLDITEFHVYLKMSIKGGFFPLIFFMDAKHSYMCYSNSATLSNLVYFLDSCTRACSYIFQSKDSGLN